MSSMLEYEGYHAIIEFSAEDNLLVGEVFGIADSLNFHGESIEEVTQMFHQSIDNYIELCKKIGKNPEREFKGTFNVRVSPELHRKAAVEATKEKMTLNQYVSRAIQNEVNEKNNLKETIVYVCKENTEPMMWNDNSLDRQMNLYSSDFMSLGKRERIAYVGN